MGEIKNGERKRVEKKRVHIVTSQNSPWLPIETSLSLQWEEGMLGETLIRSSYLAFGSGGQQVNHVTPAKKKKKHPRNNILSGLWPMALEVFPNGKHRSSDCAPSSLFQLILLFLYVRL